MYAGNLVLSSLCLLLIACSPALVQEPGELAKARQVVCMDVVPTGSLLPKRVCTTAGASAEEAAEAKEALAEAQQQQRDEIEMLEEQMRSRGMHAP